MKQLDEHLSAAPQNAPPSFMQVGISFFMYFIFLVISVIIYYTIFESLGLLSFLDFNQTIPGVLFKYFTLVLVVESLIVLSNYYLQSHLYNLFGKSVVKAALIPVLLWTTILVLFFLNIASQEDSTLVNPLIFFTRMSGLIVWYSSLSLIIAFYFQHQNRRKYYGLLFVHNLLTTAVFYF